MNKALALALALTVPTLTGPALAAVPTSLTVWLPEQGQTATLSAAGLVAADGGRIVLNRPAYDLPVERPISGGFVRLTPAGKTNPARLEVVQGGKVTASRTFPEARYGVGLQGTERGPCVSSTETDSDKSITRCFAPDLKTEWAKLDWTLNITRDGTAAYFYDTAKTGNGAASPYSPDLHVIRQNLGTGEQTPLTYRVPLNDEELKYHQGLAETYDASDSIAFAAELPGGRFVLCASTTMPKSGCRLDVVDRDLRRLFTVQGAAYNLFPWASANGKRLYAMGNTLQVWDAQTGKRLSSIHDSLWEKNRQIPLNAYLTPDGTQAAILTAGIKNGWPDSNKMTAYLYRLSDSKLLGSFAVKP